MNHHNTRFWYCFCGLVAMIVQTWDILEYLLKNAILAIFGHFGRGPSCATFPVLLFKLFYGIKVCLSNNFRARQVQRYSVGFTIRPPNFVIFRSNSLKNQLTWTAIFTGKKKGKYEFRVIFGNLKPLSTNYFRQIRANCTSSGSKLDFKMCSFSKKSL